MGSLRSAFVKVNSDPDYRAKFISDPVGVLRSEGIKLSAADAKDLRELAKIIQKNLPEIGKIPSGYEVIIEEVSGHKRRKHKPAPKDIPAHIV